MMTTAVRSLSLLALLSSTLFAAACTSEPLDMSGSWDLAFELGAGDCFQMPPGNLEFEVLGDGSAYTFETDSVDELTADWRCEVDNCTLNLEVSSSGVSAGGRAYDGTLTLDLVVDEALAVTGDASIVFTGDISCRHEMTVDGTIR